MPLLNKILGRMGDLEELEVERDTPLQNGGTSRPTFNLNWEDTREATVSVVKEIFGVVTETVNESVLGKGMSAFGEVKMDEQSKIEQAKKAQIRNQNVNTLIQSEQQHEIQKMEERVEEAARFNVADLPDEQKLGKLHLSKSMDAKNIIGPYYLAELKRAQVEEIKEAIKEEQAMEAQAVGRADPLGGHMIDTNAENQRLSQAVG